MKVRTNADTPADAKKARELGAEGIGLCRTEHMFFEGDVYKRQGWSNPRCTKEKEIELYSSKGI